jgi:hypothetical protein
MTTEELHERLRGIQGCWDHALAQLEEVSGGLEAIIKTPGENDLVAIAKHYNRDPKVFVIGIFDAVIMLNALTTVLVSTPEQDCIAFRSKDASMMPTRKPSSTGLSRGRQVGGRSSLGVSALLRRERRLL